MKTWKTLALGAAGLLVLIQFIPVARTNPPVTADLEAPAEVHSILAGACYDCHSHETRWPRYSRVAPVSWLIVHDVRTARAHLNFSLWGTYAPSAQAAFQAKVYQMVAEGEMPPLDYLLLHPHAKVPPAALEVLQRWSGSAVAAPERGDTR